jgi:homoserine trans-succinylase
MLKYIFLIYKNTLILKKHMNIENENKIQPIQILLKNIHFMYIDEMIKLIDLCVLMEVDFKLVLIKNANNNITVAEYLSSHQSIFKELPHRIINGILKSVDNNKYVELVKYMKNIDDIYVEYYEKKKMESSCYICYCDDIDDYYFSCENRHNYHSKCLMGYYNKVSIDVNCFYCKGKYDFSKVYKSCE